MKKFARIHADGSLAEASFQQDRPLDAPHKGVRWFPLIEAERSPRVHTEEVSYALDGDNVVASYVPKSVDEIRAELVREVKAEAGRRIEAIMPPHKQSNMMALAIENIRAFGPDTATWPNDMKAIAADADAKWSRIKAIRNASNVIEADVAAADFAALAAFDLSKGWPA